MITKIALRYALVWLTIASFILLVICSFELFSIHAMIVTNEHEQHCTFTNISRGDTTQSYDGICYVIGK